MKSKKPQLLKNQANDSNIQEKETPRFSDVSHSSVDSRDASSNHIINTDTCLQQINRINDSFNKKGNIKRARRSSAGDQLQLENYTKDNCNYFGKNWANTENFENFNEVLNITFNCDTRDVNTHLGENNKEDDFFANQTFYKSGDKEVFSFCNTNAESMHKNTKTTI